MKRITTLALALAFVLGAVGAAQADLEMKVRGNFEFAFGRASAGGFQERAAKMKGGATSDSMQGDSWNARQRTRVQIDFISSEQLKGVLMFEIGDLNWGRTTATNSGGAAGGALDADGVNVKTKRAYLDWVVPNTSVSVRMGIQGIALPSATGFNNPIFNADVGGITVSAPINEMIGVTAFWARPFDRFGSDFGNKNSDGTATPDKNYSDEMDMFGLLLPIKGEGWGVTPWGVYAEIGANSGAYGYMYPPVDDNIGSGSAPAWWGGVALELKMFDPLTFGMDVAYGRASKNDLSLVKEFGARGWFMDAALNYKLDWATPGIFGWYTTGDDAGDMADGWLGRIATPGGDMGFKPTSFGFAGSNGRGTDDVISQVGTGTWGAGIQLADFSFTEKLSHTLRLAYYEGTNDHNIIKANGYPRVSKFDDIYMTDKDSAWEVDLEHKYDIYENLTVFLEMGYIKLDLDEGTWGSYLSQDARESDMWKSQVLFRYQF